jgi:hypothetical protein
MTHPTKAIYYSLLRDLAKASKNSTEEQLYNEEDLDASMQQIEVVDFYATIEVAGMKVRECVHPRCPPCHGMGQRTSRLRSDAFGWWAFPVGGGRHEMATHAMTHAMAR